MVKNLIYPNVDNSTFDKPDGLETDNEYCFWESQMYSKTYFRNRKVRDGFQYYDNCNVLKYLFFYWLNKWAELISKEYFEPYKCHPLPIADQILYWQPIFSKHVSDGLVKLDLNESLKSKNTTIKNTNKFYKSIIIPALWLTFWKRTSFAVFGIIITNILSMSISFLVKHLLETLNDSTTSFYKIFLILLSIILLQILDGLFIENFNFLMYRIICIVHYSLCITLFQHGFCYRRKFFNNIEGSNVLNVCNNVLHSCSPDSECSKNPLFCPALRYQNKDIDAEILPMKFFDTYYISLFFESLIYLVQFLSNFVYGVLLISFQVKVNLWVLYVVGVCFAFLMVFVEIINTYVLKFIFLIRDYRVHKCNQIISSLPIIYKMFMDDIAINVITKCRNNELYFFFIRMFLTFFNRSLYIICVNLSFYILKNYFVKTIDNSSIVTEIDTAGFLTTLHILLKIVDSMFLFPHSVKLMANTILSYLRLEKYIKGRSPNFYISDNKYTGTNKMSADVDLVTKKINRDIVVLYRDASFTWVNNRKDLLNKNYQPYLRNINFELKRGEVVIIAGAHGSGKSNFIKSVLGEMTLVGGSMAVIPLHTSMPIFYASQDIWLQQGTIRSNITFGYRYDEFLYNKVLKAVELEFDISTWENGDMRVISDFAHTLSGGQRVRMELARAIYAYLVFNQINRKYNNNQCSFLMCLDSSFNGLDPFVSKTVFNNLFNAKSGLLIKNDLSVILSSSKTSLDICVGSSDLKNFPNIPVYNIKNEILLFHLNLSDYMEFYKEPNDIGYSYFSSTNKDIYPIISFSSDMFKICSSGYNTRLFRRLIVKSKYDNPFADSVKENSSAGHNPYLIYIKAAGITFMVFLCLTFSLAIMDNLKFVFATNLSDYITKNINDYNDGNLVSMSKIRDQAHFYLNIITGFVTTNIILSIVCSLLFTISCFLASRRIHEYCIDSVYRYDTKQIQFKKQLSQIMTYISCDIFIIDDDVCYEMYLTVVSFVEVFVNICTLFYLVPISIPFVVPTLIFVYRFVLIQFLGSSSNLYLAVMESVSHLFNVCLNTISSSSIYRSFKKEWELVNEFTEHADYKLRCRLLIYSIRARVPILFNWMFSFSTMMLVIMVVFGRYTKFKMASGHFGLGLSLCMKVIKTFTNFSFSVSCVQIRTCTLKRFRTFIPPGQKCVFKKFNNANEEDLLINYNPEHEYKIDRKKLLKRRSVEFVSDTTKQLPFRKLFFNPKINLIDVSKYIRPEHSSVELKDVYVYTSTEHKSDNMILRNINASANKSEIIGIIGRTGAGKTTLLSVLENTIINRTGQVLLDGKELQDIPRNVARQIIGVLPQLPFVFKGWTVRRFLDPRKLFSDDEINESLSNCGLLEFVSNLQGGKKLDSVIIPDNLSSSVNSGNSTTLDVDNLKDYYERCDMLLSNTQLRTLSIARLMLYRYFYRMILVDEPPSENFDSQYVDNTDNKNTQHNKLGIPIYELFKKYFSHCTTFVIAHDANVLKMCTLVWAMHEGKLIRKCKTSDIVQSGSISNIIEQMVKKV